MDTLSAAAAEAGAMASPYHRVDDTLLQSVAWICRHYGVPRSDDALLAGLPRATLLQPSLALQALTGAGLTGGLVQRSLPAIPSQVLPAILIRRESGGCILLGRRREADVEGKPQWRYQVILPEVSAEPADLSHDDLSAMYAGYAILTRPQARIETSDEDEPGAPKGHWLFSTLWHYRRYYRSAALAALIVNVLALASIFFTMNVYDRVIPNQAYVTLWSLAIGVSIAIVFEAVTRYIRAHLLDVAGKKADMVVGDALFRQALGVRMEHKPASTGAFASQLREFESVRDFIASATLAALTDLPFVLLFAAVIFMVGGWLGFIPLLMIPLIVLISVIIQWPLARIMRENLQESSQKQGVLIESIEGMETLKSARGEAWMQRRWKHCSALQSASSMKSKHYSSLATGAVTMLQQLQTIVMVVTGVYLIDAGSLTMGGLIASVMLASRATAPLGQVIGLAVRFQQAKSALVSLNKLMELPVDRDAEGAYQSQPELRGDIQLSDVGFSYPAPPMRPNPEIIKGISLSIDAGERVAVLGTIGSGKSTLLRLMARLYSPVKGQMFAGGLAVNQIDMADWRKAVSFVPQTPRLFSGTLRENIMLGCPEATPGELLRVLKLTGLDAIAARHPAGINLPVGEGGEALSGGQRQLVSLARSLLSRPTVLLLDEPTSAMDTQTEQQFLVRLEQALTDQTLVLVTHRPSLLRVVNRIIVIEDGKIVADGPRDTILATLTGSPVAQSSADKPATSKTAASRAARGPAAQARVDSITASPRGEVTQ